MAKRVEINGVTYEVAHNSGSAGGLSVRAVGGLEALDAGVLDWASDYQLTKALNLPAPQGLAFLCEGDGAHEAIYHVVGEVRS